MAQLRAKQIKLSNPGDMIIGDSNNNGSVLSMGKTAGQALVVKNSGTDEAPVLVLAYDSVAGKFVTYDDTETQLGVSSVQDAIVKLKNSVGTLTGALVYTGTVDASTPTFTPALSETVNTGTYYQVTQSGNKIPTNSGDGSGSEGNPVYEMISVGDAVVWNGKFWNVIAHIDTVVSGTQGNIKVTGSPDTGYVVSIDPTYQGQESITTVGSITTGVWNGTNVDLAHGGTNTDLSVVSDNSILFKSGNGLQVSTPPMGELPGAITGFTPTITSTDPLDYDPNTSVTLTQGSSVTGKDLVINVKSTKTAQYAIDTVKINQAGTNYATGDKIDITGFAGGYVTVGSVTGNGSIATIDISNIQNNVLLDTDKSGTNITSSIDSATTSSGTGATFDVTMTGSDQYTVSGFEIKNTGSEYKVGDVITINSSGSGSPVALGSISVTSVAQGLSGSSFMSFDPTTDKFLWVSANDISKQQDQTKEISEEFTVVESGATTGQINVGPNAVITLANKPAEGSVIVYINGVRLTSDSFTVSQDSTTTVTLNDSKIGYSLEASDVIDVTYQYKV